MKWIKNKQEEQYCKGFEDGYNNAILIDIATKFVIPMRNISDRIRDVFHPPFLFFTSSYYKGFEEGLREGADL